MNQHSRYHQEKRDQGSINKGQSTLGDTVNDQVDKLAKATCSTEGIVLNQTSNNIIHAVYTFNGKVVDIAA